MIKIECQLMNKKKDGNATAMGRIKVTGDANDIANEARVVLMQLEAQLGEEMFSKVLDDWLTYEKGFKR